MLPQGAQGAAGGGGCPPGTPIMPSPAGERFLHLCVLIQLIAKLLHKLLRRCPRLNIQNNVILHGFEWS